MTRLSSVKPFAPGKVYFIGAGPGAPDLITVRGQRLIREAQLILYAGSLVPELLITEAREASPAARIVDSSSLTLAKTHALCRESAQAGGLVARVHTGDPSLYGAIREQIQLLQQDEIEWEVVPGVTAAFAAAAAAGVSFTVPEVTQSLVITRLAGRTPVPEGERLKTLVAHGSSVAVYLSAQDIDQLQEEFSELPADTPVVCAYRVGWADEQIHWSTVGTLAATVREHGLHRQTVFLLLPGERAGVERAVSRLYSPEFQHGYRS